MVKSKYLFGITFIILLITAGLVAGTSNWNLAGKTFTIAYTCTSVCGGTYPHSMTVTVHDHAGTGDFSGNGYYIPNNAYTWDVTGAVVGNAIAYTVVYTGLGQPYSVVATGEITGACEFEGTASSSSGQTFTWETTSGCAEPAGGQEIPEFPTAALPALIGVAGFLAIRRFRDQE